MYKYLAIAFTLPLISTVPSLASDQEEDGFFVSHTIIALSDR